MRALLQPEYGTADSLVVDEIDQPVVGDDDVLVRVRAVSLNFGDRATLTGTPKLFRLFFGLLRPKNRVAGRDVAGVVEAVGGAVTRFAPGDEVFGEVGRGACAEYALATEDELVHKPAAVSFEHAAALPIAGITALQGLRDGAEVKSGQKVLIVGASGSVGTFAVQIARVLGAEVTAVCSTRNLEQARSLGAAEVIDYTQEDWTAGEARFDVVFDLVGSGTLAERRRVLAPDGLYVASFGQGGGAVLGPLVRILGVALASLLRRGRNLVLTVASNEADLLELARLVEAGELTPAIAGAWPLDEAAEAFRVLLEGHARGKLIITV